MRSFFFAAISALALCSSPVYAQGVGKIDGRLAAKGLDGNGATNGQQLVWSSSLGKWVPTTVASGGNETLAQTLALGNSTGATNLVVTAGQLIQFGGTTSSFPALKRSSTTLIARLADDSADAPFQAASLSLTTALPATSGGTGQSSFTVGDLLYASTTTAISKLAASTSGYVLTSNGAGVAPSWQAAAGGSLSGITNSAAGILSWSTGSTANPGHINGPTDSSLKIWGGNAGTFGRRVDINGGNCTTGTAGGVEIFGGVSGSGGGGYVSVGGSSGVGSGNAGGDVYVDGGGAGSGNASSGGVYVATQASAGSGTPGPIELKTKGTSDIIIKTANTERARFLGSGSFFRMSEAAANAGTTDLTSLAHLAVYMKSDKFVIAYNNAGTITYITIPLDGATTTWTHSTSAP